MDLLPAGMSSDEDDDLYDYGYFREKNDEVPARAVPRIHSEELNREIASHFNKEHQITLLHRAVEEEDFDTVKDLIDAGVAIDSSSPSEWTVLMKACSLGNASTVEKLLDLGADPNFHKEKFTPLMACCIKGYEPEESKLECIRLLLSRGADINAQNKFKSTALIEAVCNDWEIIVDELLESPDIKIDMQDKEGWTALHHATSNNKLPLIQLLLEAGANACIKDVRQEYTPIDIAILKDLKEAIKIFGVQGDPIESEVGIPVHKDLLSDFLSQLPNNDGSGGFNNDVESIFNGLGLDNAYKKLNTHPSLPDFLNMTDSDLEKIGVRFAPHREKILWKGIHRYHLHAWKKSSMLPISRGTKPSLEMLINITATTLKHLCIVQATLQYLHSRTLKRSKLKIQNDVHEGMEIVSTLTEIYVDINQMSLNFAKLINQVNHMKTAGKAPADFVGPDSYKEPKIWKKYAVPLVSTILMGSTIYYWKTR